MKKASFILAGLVLLGLVYTFQIAKGETNEAPQNTTSEYIIIKYYPSLINDDVVVYAGDNKVQHVAITKEQRQDGRVNVVIDLMNKYSADGYTLVSTMTGAGGSEFVLRKTK